MGAAEQRHDPGAVLNRRAAAYAAVVTGAVVVAVLSYIPIIIVVSNSLKSTTALATQGPFALFSGFAGGNYATAARGVAGYLGNTLIVGAVTIALAVPCAALAAYGFARARFRGRESLFYLYLGLLMVPATLTLIPLFVEIKDFGLFDNWGALILPYAAAAQPLLVLLMRTFFEGISRDLFHAARIDGAGELTVIRKIVVPLSWPILLTGAVIVATNVWGDYLWPTIVIPDTGKLTISAGLQTFAGSLGALNVGAGVAFASYVLTMLPLFALVALTMKHFVAGVTAGSGTL